jgi:hypothetical protein
MQLAGRESWQIREDRWIQHFEWALWIRAAERIDVPAGGIVPGPLLIDPVPEASPGLDRAALAEEWASWWRALCGLPDWSPSDDPPPPRFAHSGPEFDGLVGQPLLRAVMVRRWMAVRDWHGARKLAGLRRGLHRGAQVTAVVAEVEQGLGRTARPFGLCIDVLPVDDQEIRAIGENRFLVPEVVRDGAGWTSVLRGLVEARA